MLGICSFNEEKQFIMKYIKGIVMPQNVPLGNK